MTNLHKTAASVANGYEMQRTELVKAAAQGRERGLLEEIGALADRVRDMRRTNARDNKAQIKVLTSDLCAKWNEMRALRAPLLSGDVSWGRHGHYD